MPRVNRYPMPPSPDGKIHIGIRVSVELAEEMKGLARAQKMWIGGLWERAAEEYLKKNNKEGVSRKV